MVGVVLDVDFYAAGKLPENLEKYAREQAFFAERGIVAVKTVMSSTKQLSYIFEHVGSSPREIQSFMHRLAACDGADLNELVKKAFAEA